MNPLIQQYNSIKEKYKDAVLLFRVGDEYQAFNEDTARLGKTMGILMLEKEGDPEIKKMASLPVYSLDYALRVLTKAGYGVAVCEAVEEPKGRR